jgi:hypothetical protein
MFEHQCKICNKEGKYIKNSFDVVAKTFYKIKGDLIMCYRHWHQAGRPQKELHGSYGEITEAIKLEKQSIFRKSIKRR